LKKLCRNRQKKVQPPSSKPPATSEASKDTSAVKHDCPNCPKKFTSSAGLEAHRKAKHSGAPPPAAKAAPKATAPPLEGAAPAVRQPPVSKYPDTVTQKAVELLPKADGKVPARRWLKSCLAVDFNQAVKDFEDDELTVENHLEWLKPKRASKRSEDAAKAPAEINRVWKVWKDAHKDVRLVNPPRSEVQKEALSVLSTLRKRARKLPEEHRKKVNLPKPKAAPKERKGGNAPRRQNAPKSREEPSSLATQLKPLVDLLTALKPLFK